MTLRRSLAAALAALPVALGLAVYTSRPRAFSVDLSADEVDRQLFERNDD
ncbi:MAG: hypothetical protein AAGI52_18015 [Bacteroidota bacterium]